MSSLNSPASFNLQVFGLGTGTGTIAFNTLQNYQAGTVPAAELTGSGLGTAFAVPTPIGFSGYSNLGAFSADFQADSTISGQDDLVVNYAAVPEPGSLGLLGLAALGLLGRHRRRRAAEQR